MTPTTAPTIRYDIFIAGDRSSAQKPPSGIPGGPKLAAPLYPTR